MTRAIQAIKLPGELTDNGNTWKAYIQSMDQKVGAPLRDERIRQDVDMFTARINYRFGGPVVAKY